MSSNFLFNVGQPYSMVYFMHMVIWTQIEAEYTRTERLHAGSYGMNTNSAHRLACYTEVPELDTSLIACEPSNNFPIIHELVTDFTQ